MPHILIKRNLSESVLSQIPILRQIRRLMDIINENDGIKMTETGNLPTRIVKELYPLGVPDWFVEFGYSKVYREDKLECIKLMHFLAKTCGAVRMFKGKLILTKKGKEWLQDPWSLLCELIHTVVWKIDNGGMDAYMIGNINSGIPDALMLLYKYGSEPREAQFYAEEFAKVCPAIMDISDELSYRDITLYRSRCFSTRIITRGLFLFGVAECIEGKYDSSENKMKPDMIVRKALFDEIFEYVESIPERLLQDDDSPACSTSTITLNSKAEAFALISALRSFNPSNDKLLN